MRGKGAGEVGGVEALYLEGRRDSLTCPWAEGSVPQWALRALQNAAPSWALVRVNAVHPGLRGFGQQRCLVWWLLPFRVASELLFRGVLAAAWIKMRRCTSSCCTQSIPYPQRPSEEIDLNKTVF